MLKKTYLILLTLCTFCCSTLRTDEERLLLVTGCCYSGTGYTAKVLQKCGLDIGHEWIGIHGSVSWPMAVNTKNVLYGQSRYGFHFTHIFHQVRHPLKSITSFYINLYSGLWNIFPNLIPEMNASDPLIVNCAKYWYYWNLLVDKEAEWTYRIEDLDNVWDEFQNRLGIQLNRKAMESISKTTHHKKDHAFEFSWEDLRQSLNEDLYQKIRALATHYGYSLED